MKSVILSTHVAVSGFQQAQDTIIELCRTGQQGYVCLANVHMCMEALDDPDFALLLSQARLVLADGRPLCWMQRLMGHTSARQIRGQDLFLALCEQAQHHNIRVGIYGGSDSVQLQQLTDVLLNRFPRLHLAYRFAPPFRPLTACEEEKVREDIQAQGVQLLFVGLGCPKQEKWMASHQHLGPLMIGIGAAVDFITGTKLSAPRWMQKIGLEWLYRFSQEPRRLFWRYIKHNPRFLLLGLWQVIGHWWNRLVSRKQLGKP
ncbi:WecB/TagA/CpsF family glycosyltransferase [Bowmanella denitrificans]|uniref:WecB/TagA/CpsF family glycosyltransferase n=1 Tax=Bowmanella denitrificans TaxID=366582 RepID=UPI000C99C6D3|nr:WecB/TagA/CpsF family glycosyltransferase [Bowmanella denitrificans]